MPASESGTGLLYLDKRLTMKKLLFLLTLLLLSSCKNPYEDIIFVEIKNPALEKATPNQLDILATCVLYNPNSAALNLEEVDLDVYINGNKIALIHQVETVVMPSSSEFEFAIRTALNPREVYGDKGKGVLGAALQILASQKVDVKYEGSIKVGIGAFYFRIPVADSWSVPVRFNF
jgi:LEA14-like dessication related protein